MPFTVETKSSRGLPAYCPNCKNLHESSLIILGEGARNITISTNMTDKCPICRGPTWLISGTYSFLRLAVDAAAELRLQPGALQLAADVARRAAVGAIDQRAAVDEVQLISRQAGNLFREIFNIINNSAQLTAALLGIATFFMVYGEDVAETIRARLSDLAQVLEPPGEIVPQSDADQEWARPRPRPKAQPYEECPDQKPDQSANRQMRRRAKALKRQSRKKL